MRYVYIVFFNGAIQRIYRTQAAAKRYADGFARRDFRKFVKAGYAPESWDGIIVVDQFEVHL
jgi:hypothetical protein